MPLPEVPPTHVIFATDSITGVISGQC